MELESGSILLRDYVLSDIADDIRWFNEETAWAVADSPWEPVEPVDPEAYRVGRLDYIAHSTELPALRFRLEIEAAGRHIGFVSASWLDADGNWLPRPVPGARRFLGIELCEPDCWGRGYGTAALAAYIRHHLDQGVRELYLETWSGNTRMMGCAARLGFVECGREAGVRLVDGMAYDSLSYRLDVEAFLSRSKENA